MNWEIMLLSGALGTVVTTFFAYKVRASLKQQEMEQQFIIEQKYINDKTESRLTELKNSVEKIDDWREKHTEDSVEIRRKLFDGLNDLKGEVKTVIALLEKDIKYLKDHTDGGQ